MIETNIGNKTFEYSLHRRTDAGFVGFDVVDEVNNTIVDVGFQVMDDGRVLVAVHYNGEEQFLKAFAPPVDFVRVREHYMKLMRDVSELPSNLQAAIEDHPEIDVLISHIHQHDLTYDDLDRLERLERMVGAAERFVQTMK